ncbi:MAG: DNA integrity scanning protein DisA nucleotide-binding domain protein [Planctomycetes bacterium]|nr:DNA integrity scanning protein DisA nucleotide-binding domain protein [Planctomycetota bacterium]
MAERVSSVLGGTNAAPASVSLSALRAAFDEQVVAAHIKAHHGLDINIADVLGSIHELAEQTYENKSLAFGCLIDPNWVVDGEAVFPSTMLESKKYRALSDGFKTAYHVATGGHLLGFVDLENFDRRKLGARHYFPEWCEDIAKASRGGRCGISLTRNGEILVFDEGSLRFSYRFGRWQYWNHSHLVDLLRNLTRVQRVPTERVSTVAAAVYRVALDVSFRRTGALFVILRNERNLRKVVRRGDAINDRRRETIDKQFDDALPAGTIQSLPRGVIAEIAALDGAIVMNNRGQILAYGAVLNPQKKGRISRAEGSRTKAAIGASHYGLAVKVSADGDITVYHQGNRFISV